jgi:hypothetical protein
MDHGVTGLLSGTDNIPGFFASWSRTLLYMNPLLFFFGIAAVIYYTCRKTRSSFWIIPAWFWSGSLLFVLSRWPNARNAALAYPAIQICIVSMIWELKNIRLKNILICSISVVYFINILLMSGTFLYPNSFYALNEDGKTPSDVVREYRDKVLKPGA